MVTEQEGNKLQQLPPPAADPAEWSLNHFTGTTCSRKAGALQPSLRRDSSKLFPLAIIHKDNRHAGGPRALKRGLLPPTRPSGCHQPHHMCSLILRGPGLPLHAAALQLPFQRSPVQCKSETHPIYALFWQLHSFALLRYVSPLGESPGIKHRNIGMDDVSTPLKTHFYKPLFLPGFHMLTSQSCRPRYLNNSQYYLGHRSKKGRKV